MTDVSKRSLIRGLVSFLAAPAIVRCASLMPVKALVEPVEAWTFTEHSLGFSISRYTLLLSEAECRRAMDRGLIPYSAAPRAQWVKIGMKDWVRVAEDEYANVYRLR